MADNSFDYQGALSAGYSPQEIVQYLKANPDADPSKAVINNSKNGYSDAEQADHLANQYNWKPPAPPPQDPANDSSMLGAAGYSLADKLPATLESAGAFIANKMGATNLSQGLQSAADANNQAYAQNYQRPADVQDPMAAIRAGDIGGAVRGLGYTAAENAGNLVPLAGAAAAEGLSGGAATPLVAPLLGILGGAQGIDAIKQERKAQGLDPNAWSPADYASAAGQAAMYGTPSGKVLGGLSGLGRVGADIALQGAKGAGADALNYGAVRFADGGNGNSPDLVNRFGDDFLQGAVAGGIGHGVATAAQVAGNLSTSARTPSEIKLYAKENQEQQTAGNTDPSLTDFTPKAQTGYLRSQLVADFNNTKNEIENSPSAPDTVSAKNVVDSMIDKKTSLLTDTVNGLVSDKQITPEQAKPVLDLINQAASKTPLSGDAASVVTSLGLPKTATNEFLTNLGVVDMASTLNTKSTGGLFEGMVKHATSSIAGMAVGSTLGLAGVHGIPAELAGAALFPVIRPFIQKPAAALDNLVGTKGSTPTDNMVARVNAFNQMRGVNPPLAQASPVDSLVAMQQQRQQQAGEQAAQNANLSQGFANAPRDQGWLVGIANKLGTSTDAVRAAIGDMATKGIVSPDMVQALHAQKGNIPQDVMEAITTHARNSYLPSDEGRQFAPSFGRGNSYEANVADSQAVQNDLRARYPQYADAINNIIDPVQNGKTADGRLAILHAQASQLSDPNERAAMIAALTPLTPYGQKTVAQPTVTAPLAAMAMAKNPVVETKPIQQENPASPAIQAAMAMAQKPTETAPTQKIMTGQDVMDHVTKNANWIVNKGTPKGDAEIAVLKNAMANNKDLWTELQQIYTEPTQTKQGRIAVLQHLLDTANSDNWTKTPEGFKSFDAYKNALVKAAKPIIDVGRDIPSTEPQVYYLNRVNARKAGGKLYGENDLWEMTQDAANAGKSKKKK